MSRTPIHSDDCTLVADSPVRPDATSIRPASEKSDTGVYAAAWWQRPRFFTDMSNRNRGDIVKRQNPVILPDTATVQLACRVMRDQRIGAVLVTGPDGRLAGLFTGRDAVGRVVAEALDPATTSLYSVMTLEPEALQPHVHASDALRMMQEGGYRHMPIIDGSRVAGIVSRGDFVGEEQIRLDEASGFWQSCEETPDAGTQTGHRQVIVH